MADFDAEEYPPAGPDEAEFDGFDAEEHAAAGPVEASVNGYPAEEPQGTAAAVLHFHMYALDLNALPTIIYREWTVTGQGDFTAALYTGPHSGAFVNFGFISVLNTFVK